MPAGGSLTIETRPGDAPNFVTIAVVDSGTGMPQSVFDRIFEPFFTTKATGHGTGLGLPIVRRIIDGAGGDVAVESRLGLGTRIRINLPAVIGKAPEARASTMADLRGSETILLVEDEAALRRLALRILGDHGYVVHAAANADEARELWGQYRDSVDLLLSDVTMPGLSGPDLAAELARTRPVPTLFVSGHLSSDPATSALARGARFLQKPFAVEALLKAVRETLAAPDQPGLPDV
jgi:CheY-like chemotaxis protein